MIQSCQSVDCCWWRCHCNYDAITAVGGGAEGVGRHRFSIGSRRDNYIKLLPKQPAAQSYALRLRTGRQFSGGKAFQPLAPTPIFQHTTSRFGPLSSLRVVSGCVIFCFLFQPASQPADCSFCGPAAWRKSS